MSEISQEWSRRLAPVCCAWKHGHLTDGETAGLSLLISLQLRLPHHWLMGRDPLPVIEKGGCLVHDWIEFEPRLQRWIQPTMSLGEVLAAFNLRGVRLVARRALLNWLSGEWDLRLTDRIPSPEEMLNLQIQGGRWVSMIFDEARLSQIVHDDRDALSLLLHDLGHADQFFSNPEQRRGQIAFYSLLNKARQAGLLNEPSDFDPNWQERLEYLISDLNTHPAHFVSVFWASARQSFNGNPAFQNWRQKLYLAWDLSKTDQEAHEKLIDGFSIEAAQQVVRHLDQLRIEPMLQLAP